MIIFGKYCHKGLKKYLRYPSGKIIQESHTQLKYQAGIPTDVQVPQSLPPITLRKLLEECCAKTGKEIKETKDTVFPGSNTRRRRRRVLDDDCTACQEIN